MVHRDVAALVRDGWGIEPRAVERIMYGLDDAATAYAVTAAGRYFVKVRSAAAGSAVVLVPDLLRRTGITAVVAPIPTADGRPWFDADGHQVLLYPFVDGVNAWDGGLTDEQYVAYGRSLAAIHATAVPPHVAGHVPVETFDPPSFALLADVRARVADRPDLLAVWRDDAVSALVAQALARRDQAAAHRAPHVLCHGDIHTGNLLVGPSGELSIVDWDAPVLAPPERDLVFVLCGPWSEQPVTEHRRALFRQGYGDHPVHGPTLEYYRTERLVDDVAQFARQILDPATDEADRRTARYWLERNLAAL